MKLYKMKFILGCLFIGAIVVICSCRSSIPLQRSGLPQSYDYIPEKQQPIEAVRNPIILPVSSNKTTEIILPNSKVSSSLPKIPSYYDIPELPESSKSQSGVKTITTGKLKGTYNHLVISGDTLSLIARNYNCQIEDICRLNKGLSIQNLRIGMVIIVPYYK